MASKKRRTAPVDLEDNAGKRVKLSTTRMTQHLSVSSSQPEEQPTKNDLAIRPIQPPSQSTEPSTNCDHAQEDIEQQAPAKPAKKRPSINKLAPPRPFPPVAASASATGPRSVQKEGRNYICLTRKTSLGAYMRKCKNLLVGDGYKVLHLHAMGAAIPLLLQLSCALPPILPFPSDEIHTELSTDTVELRDEIIPDDEEEDATYRTRGKSTLYVVIRIGDGQSEMNGLEQEARPRIKAPGTSKSQRKEGQGPIIYEEPEQELVDI